MPTLRLTELTRIANLHRLSPIAFSIFFLLALVGCKSDSRSSKAIPVSKGVVIGVAMKTETQPRWRFDLASMQQEAKVKGAKLLVQWANDDPLKQDLQVESLLSQGVQALIVVPVDDKAARALVKKAHDFDVPIIAYDVAIPNSTVDYYVTRDNRRTARLHMEGALEFAPPDGSNPPKYALIKGDSANNVAREFAEEYERILRPLVNKGTIKIVTDQWHKDWSANDALKTAENTLAMQNDDVRAFVTSSDGMAIGVAQAVQSRGLGGKIYISGTDVEPAVARLIVKGIIMRSIWTRIDLMGRRAVRAATALARKEIPEKDASFNNGSTQVPVAFVDVQPVTKDNMCQWITSVAPEGWATVDQVYAGTLVPPECKR